MDGCSKAQRVRWVSLLLFRGERLERDADRSTGMPPLIDGEDERGVMWSAHRLSRCFAFCFCARADFLCVGGCLLVFLVHVSILFRFCVGVVLFCKCWSGMLPVYGTCAASGSLFRQAGCCCLRSTVVDGVKVLAGAHRSVLGKVLIYSLDLSLHD